MLLTTLAERGRAFGCAGGEPRSNGLGVLGLTQALGDLGATVVAGLLWSLISPRVGFGYAQPGSSALFVGPASVCRPSGGYLQSQIVTRKGSVGGRPSPPDR